MLADKIILVHWAKAGRRYGRYLDAGSCAFVNIDPLNAMASLEILCHQAFVISNLTVFPKILLKLMSLVATLAHKGIPD